MMTQVTNKRARFRKFSRTGRINMISKARIERLKARVFDNGISLRTASKHVKMNPNLARKILRKEIVKYFNLETND